MTVMKPNKTPKKTLDVSESVALMLGKDTAEEFVHRLENLNLMLKHIQDQIIELQEEKWGYNINGNVLLRANDCGHGCLGCPHHKWYVTRVRVVRKEGAPNKGKRFVFYQTITHAAKVKRVQLNPALSALVGKANNIIESRARLVSHLGRLRRHLSNTEIPVYNPATYKT